MSIAERHLLNHAKQLGKIICEQLLLFGTSIWHR